MLNKAIKILIIFIILGLITGCGSMFKQPHKKPPKSKKQEPCDCPEFKNKRR